MNTRTEREKLVSGLDYKIQHLGLVDTQKYQTNLSVLRQHLDNPEYFTQLQQIYFSDSIWKSNTGHIPFHLQEIGYDLEKIVDSNSVTMEVLVKKPGVYRTPGILMYNPGTDSFESWSQVYHDSYDKHRGANKSASQFLDKDESYHIEKSTFFEGFGYLRERSNQLSMFARFNKVIGKSNNRDTSLVKVYATRKLRNKSSGYLTTIHGFPIGESELQKSNTLTKDQKEKILDQKISL